MLSFFAMATGRIWQTHDGNYGNSSRQRFDNAMLTSNQAFDGSFCPWRIFFLNC